MLIQVQFVSHIFECHSCFLPLILLAIACVKLPRHQPFNLHLFHAFFRQNLFFLLQPYIQYRPPHLHRLFKVFSYRHAHPHEHCSAILALVVFQLPDRVLVREICVDIVAGDVVELHIYSFVVAADLELVVWLGRDDMDHTLRYYFAYMFL